LLWKNVLIEPAFEMSSSILKQDRLNNEWYRLRLSAPPSFFKKFTPGMFVMIKIVDRENDPFLRRPFSIAYISVENGWFEVIYRLAGKGSLLLSLKKQGEYLNLIGPLGNGFEISNNFSSLCLVAGGIGIAPLLSLQQTIIDVKGVASPFLWGVGSRDYLVDFNQIYPDIAPFDFIVSSDDGSVGKKGNVANLLLAFLEERSLDSVVVFACGPIKMLSAVDKICSNLEVTLYVSIESKMACGQGYCMGCAVPSSEAAESGEYLKVCRDGPVFNANLLDWSKIESAIG